MKIQTHLEDKIIDLDLIYRDRRTLAIKIEPPGIITVLSPEGMGTSQVLDKVRSKSGWITKKLDEVERASAEVYCRRFQSGERFLYLGKYLILKVCTKKGIPRPQVSSGDGYLTVKTPSGDKALIKNTLRRWYRDKARDVLKERMEILLPLSDKKPSLVKVKEQKKRWGSCTPAGRIYINWRIVMAPLGVIDYLIVHELAHLYFSDHSKDFWEKVSVFLPDYAVRRKWLRKNSLKLEL